MAPSLLSALLAFLSLRLVIAQSFSCRSFESYTRAVHWTERCSSRTIVSQHYPSSIKQFFTRHHFVTSNNHCEWDEFDLSRLRFVSRAPGFATGRLVYRYHWSYSRHGLHPNHTVSWKCDGGHQHHHRAWRSENRQCEHRFCRVGNLIQQHTICCRSVWGRWKYFSGQWDQRRH